MKKHKEKFQHIQNFCWESSWVLIGTESTTFVWYILNLTKRLLLHLSLILGPYSTAAQVQFMPTEISSCHLLSLLLSFALWLSSCHFCNKAGNLSQLFLQKNNSLLNLMCILSSCTKSCQALLVYSDSVFQVCRGMTVSIKKKNATRLRSQVWQSPSCLCTCLVFVTLIPQWFILFYLAWYFPFQGHGEVAGAYGQRQDTLMDELPVCTLLPGFGTKTSARVLQQDSEGVQAPFLLPAHLPYSVKHGDWTLY